MIEARVLKVEREWLIHGIGEVEGEPPFIENPDETFVAIAHASPRRQWVAALL